MSDRVQEWPGDERKSPNVRRMALHLGTSIGMPTITRRYGAQTKPHLFMDLGQWLCRGQKRPAGIGYDPEGAYDDWKKREGVMLMYADDENAGRAALNFHLGSKSASH